MRNRGRNALINFGYNLIKNIEISWVLATGSFNGDWRDKMIEVGRLCIKIAGRDAGKKAVVVDILDDKFVLIDGEARRRKCNILHIEPLKEVIKIKKNAGHEEVKKAFEELGLKARETKPKEKKTQAKGKKAEEKEVKKEEKKAKKKETKTKKAVKKKE